MCVCAGTTTIDVEDRYFSKPWRKLQVKPLERRTLHNPSSSFSQVCYLLLLLFIIIIIIIIYCYCLFIVIIIYYYYLLLFIIIYYYLLNHLSVVRCTILPLRSLKYVIYYYYYYQLPVLLQ